MARPESVDRDSGLACLAIVARLHEIAIDPAQEQHRLALSAGAIDADELVRIARHHQLKARWQRASFKRLATAPLPAIMRLRDGECVIAAKCDGERLLVHDPALGKPRLMARTEVDAEWSGDLLLLASRATEVGALARFDLSWFIPVLFRYRRLLAEVLVASLFVQLFALITPLLFQVVMDKVLVHESHSTLTVIAIGLGLVAIFEVVVSYLRTYILTHTTCRIDVELGAKLFRHLISLPLSYFEVRRVGDSVARVRELENVRAFLTGPALTSVLDLLFSVIFIAVMFFYSFWLTIIVIISLPLYALISVVITPILRARIEVMFNRGADSQAFLVEAVSGIGTAKAAAIEPQMVKRWDDRLAGYTHSVFSVVKLGAMGSESVSLVNKLMTVAILWFGAELVMQQQLTVGQLIAFNMLAGHVTAPIIRLAQLWQDFQRTGIAVDRLGDVLNAVAEPRPALAAALPPITGRIEFDNVRFRYRPDAPEVLRGIGLTVKPGEVVGIVGQSGSGKSTLTKLVQRLHVPESGRVLIDGVDIAIVDPAWLRRQLGVVLQENLLFRRTVRENIALADPATPLERVIAVAKLAAAHDFIVELPNQYDTLIEEHGANLSGGQRQRLAIARALITDPRILIFDEATSALDYESESAIMANMRSICAGRTVLLIAHRLSTIRHADRIIVMHRGEIVESGSHDELLARPGAYARLHSLQNGGKA